MPTPSLYLSTGWICWIKQKKQQWWNNKTQLHCCSYSCWPKQRNQLRWNNKTQLHCCSYSCCKPNCVSATSFDGGRVIHRIKLSTLFIYRFVYNPATAPSANIFGWPPMRRSGGDPSNLRCRRGKRLHHGDGVCGIVVLGSTVLSVLFPQ
jgi:hypothetical protein